MSEEMFDIVSTLCDFGAKSHVKARCLFDVDSMLHESYPASVPRVNVNCDVVDYHQVNNRICNNF